MVKRLSGKAMHAIPYGAMVLCRNMEVRRADPKVANGTADPEPYWKGRGKKGYKRGEWVSVTAVEGLGERDLHAIAAGPIMEPLALYLPAGKLTTEEYQERLALQFREAGIDAP